MVRGGSRGSGYTTEESNRLLVSQVRVCFKWVYVVFCMISLFVGSVVLGLPNWISLSMLIGFPTFLVVYFCIWFCKVWKEK